MVGFRELALFVGIVLTWVSAAPVIDKRAARVLPGKYIVTLKPGVSVDIVGTHLRWVRDIHTRSLSRRDTAGVEKVFNVEDFNAYAGTFDSATLAKIRESEDVAAIEPDMIWHLDSTFVTQAASTWGLGSISHREPGHTNYIYHPSAGQGTFAYVIDSGIRTTHSEFEGRAYLGYNAMPETPFVDSLGHGTHVAGTIGGKTYGVAKKTTLIAVRVFDIDEVATSIVMDGFTWAIQDIITQRRTNSSVVNMSLGGPYSAAFNLLMSTSSSLGILSVVSAGNDGILASEQSPASSPEAITVGAIDATNTKPQFSNYGDAVDIFAPGADVLSAYITDDTATARGRGTSMAAPHVTGAILALRAMETNYKGGMATFAWKIMDLATKGVLKSIGEGSPNFLLYNGSGA
ncbi:peptidase S8/S53 domain-containing protein [Immersiella caudata]|uniref:Peptidase S8/S53 domain-containing protein n=1 Tax=Immersiella caudata TaxID=314043 RepID=A0AA39THT3_9PEZI|nr:peptidase S8/S53 domain-containing protein [Immersiella caudata]